MRSSALRIPMLGAALVLAAGVAVPAGAQTSSGGTEATVDRPGLTVAPAALLDRTVRLRGRTEKSAAGRAVSIDKQAADGSWVPVAATMVEADGTFTTLWKTDTIGAVTLRASVQDTGSRASAAANPLLARLTVFRPAVASWYGPGLYGRRTACGTKLTKRTLGVAHRTLPCGTLVTLYHRGRTVTAPVIDRGPFIAGRDWDLTRATAVSVGMTQTSRIGFLPPEGVPLRRAG